MTLDSLSDLQPTGAGGIYTVLIRRHPPRVTDEPVPVRSSGHAATFQHMLVTRICAIKHAGEWLLQHKGMIARHGSAFGVEWEINYLPFIQEQTAIICPCHKGFFFKKVTFVHLFMISADIAIGSLDTLVKGWQVYSCESL